MTRTIRGLDFDALTRRVRSESDRRKAYEATTPLWIFRHDWRDGMRTFQDLRAAEIGIMTYDGPDKPKFELHGTIYGTPAKGARLLREPSAEDLAEIEAIDLAIKNLHERRRALLETAWFRGRLITPTEVLDVNAAKRKARLDDHQ